MIDATADATAPLYWFGRDEFRSEGDRIRLPDAAFDVGRIAAGERTYWGGDPEVPVAFLGNDEDLFEDDEGVLFAGSADADGDGAVDVPALLVAGEETRPGEKRVPVFEPGEPIHFLTNPELREAGVVMAAPQQIARRFFEDRLA